MTISGWVFTAAVSRLNGAADIAQEQEVRVFDLGASRAEAVSLPRACRPRTSTKSGGGTSYGASHKATATLRRDGKTLSELQAAAGKTVPPRGSKDDGNSPRRARLLRRDQTHAACRCSEASCPASSQRSNGLPASGTGRQAAGASSARHGGRAGVEHSPKDGSRELKSGQAAAPRLGSRLIRVSATHGQPAGAIACADI